MPLLSRLSLLLSLRTHISACLEIVCLTLFWVFATGMAEKWRQDKSIVLADVVGSFKVFKDCNKKMVEPSDEELERVFGTKDRDAVVRRILETGEIQGELHTL
eukprot:TRINITY_DN1291_c0_g1_i1.p1 TRINITY_DN1291_c0_g1~~TRINITY_DN1291_c0_g1_i1.p1  ORF type:complete len:103 (+),score=11.00 TRINITY_DN1291_c0_g1_i1:349-657(+)